MTLKEIYENGKRIKSEVETTKDIITDINKNEIILLELKKGFEKIRLEYYRKIFKVMRDLEIDKNKLFSSYNLPIIESLKIPKKILKEIEKGD